MPSVEYIALFVPRLPTATNFPVPPTVGDHATDLHAAESSAEAWSVQLMPLEDYIARLVPALATATNSAFSGDQHTDIQVLPVGSDGVPAAAVQEIPSAEYMTFPAAVLPTETKRPSDGDHATDFDRDAVPVPLARFLVATFLAILNASGLPKVVITSDGFFFTRTPEELA